MAEQLFVGLYTDADVTPKLARLLREREFDAVSAQELGNAELEDSEHLAYAASRGRTILTYNSKDYAPLFDQYWWTGREHYGIIVSEQLPIGELLRRVLRFLNTVTADEMRNNYKNLGEFVER
jgi:predicted nuclease of predicted toxin-antitoxin system